MSSRKSNDLQKYPRKVIWVFEVIGTYFVDQFYNKMYVMAKKSAEIGDVPNITDGYRMNALRYQHGICTNAVYYKQAVALLLEYYKKYSGQGTTTMSDFEDQVLTQFIPDEFYDSFNDADKNKALHEIVACIVTALCEAVVSRDMLPKIIDSHSDVSNVAHLQQMVVSALCTRRDDYYVRFAKQATRSANGNTSVDIDTFNALKAEYIAEKRAKCDAETTIVKLKQMLASAVGRIKEQGTDLAGMDERLIAADSRIAELSAELEIMRQAERGRRREQTPYPRGISPRDNTWGVQHEPVYQGASQIPPPVIPVVDPHVIPPAEQEPAPSVLDILGMSQVDDFQKKYGVIDDPAEKKDDGWGLDDTLW